MQQLTDRNNTHSNASGGEIGAESRRFGAVRRIAPFLVLIGLLVAGRFVAPTGNAVIERSAIAFSSDFATSGVGADNIHRADLLQDIIDLLQEIIDVLDDRKPIVTPEQEPVLTEEEQDEVNDSVDVADGEGVDVPEERIEANWTYDEVYDFITFVIDAVEDFMHSSGE